MARAVARYVRVSPRKAQAVLKLIQGKSVAEAQRILTFMPKAAARLALKVLRSAVANAINNDGLAEEDLYVRQAVAGQGPVLKRIMPRAQGRAARIRKPTSHITIVVEEKP